MGADRRRRQDARWSPSVSPPRPAAKRRRPILGVRPTAGELVWFLDAAPRPRPDALKERTCMAQQIGLIGLRRHGREPRPQHRAQRLPHRGLQPELGEDRGAARRPRQGQELRRRQDAGGVRRRARAPAPHHHHGEGRRAGRRGDRRAEAAAGEPATSSSTAATRTSPTPTAASPRSTRPASSSSAWA